jgi:hypothetical protein
MIDRKSITSTRNALEGDITDRENNSLHVIQTDCNVNNLPVGDRCDNKVIN